MFILILIEKQSKIGSMTFDLADKPYTTSIQFLEWNVIFHHSITHHKSYIGYEEQCISTLLFLRVNTSIVVHKE